MSSIKIPLVCDTSVFKQYPDCTYKDSSYLILITENYIPLSKILFKLAPIFDICLQTCQVTSAKLCFKVVDLTGNLSKITLYKNLSDYSSSTVTWSNCPPGELLVETSDIFYNKHDNLLEINLDDLVPYFNNNTDFDFGFQVEPKGCDLYDRFYSSRCWCFPYLEIECIPSECPKKLQSYLQGYINNNPSATSIVVKKDEIIPFNAVNTSRDITLNSITHEITITKAGTYNVDWWIDYSGTLASNRIILTLKKGNTPIYSSSAPNTSSGFLSGHAILIISNEDIVNHFKITLCNTSQPLNSDELAAAIYLSPTNMPASIRISSF